MVHSARPLPKKKKKNSAGGKLHDDSILNNSRANMMSPSEVTDY